MGENGFIPYMLFGLRKPWDNRDVNDLQDYYGQEWVSEKGGSGIWGSVIYKLYALPPSPHVSIF